MAEHDEDTEQLLQRWHDGDRAALAPLVERDRAWVEAQLRRRRGRLLQRLEETGDGVQDLMVRAPDYAPRFRVANRGQFRALLSRMLGNLLIDRARCLGRQPPPMTLSEADASRARLDLTGGTTAAPPAAAERAERLAWIRLGLEFLPAEDRQLIRARTFDELDLTAAGARVGLSADAARMRLQRALLRLAGVVDRLRRGQLDALLADGDRKGGPE